MKGFVYLLEISVALILILMVLGTLSFVQAKQSWERTDLISTGENIVNTIKYGSISKLLNGNFSEVEAMLPPNIDFGIKVSGIPKSNITVGCVNYCSYISSLLTPSYINGHWVNFTVISFSIVSLNYIPSYFDAIVFVNYTEYSSRKSNITDYLNKGGVVIGINATFNSNDVDFNEIFNLSSYGSAGGNFHFSSYNPSIDEIEKYFLGIGFDVNTTGIVDSKKWGNLTVWEVTRKLNLSSSGLVDVENKTADEGLIRNIAEDGTFKLKGPDLAFYTFKVKKIFWDSKVIIQPLNTSFVFKDFSETNDVTGKINTVVLTGGQAVMVSNNTGIWISDFIFSDEYRTLVKAAIASRINNWYAKQVDLSKENVGISSFVPLCCNMPETAELTFYLWYKI
jgi:hypothetical protein